MSGLQVKLIDDTDLMHWKAEIKGPMGTPYEGGRFAIDIMLPNDYPFVPPKVRAAWIPGGVAWMPTAVPRAQMKFDTKVWHPNISSESGAICLDILKNEWSPALTIRTALISLQALMSAPEPDDPQDAVVAKQYKEKFSEFTNTAKFWTDTYATGLESDDAKVVKLMEMGFERDACAAALTKANGNPEAALELLLTGA